MIEIRGLYFRYGEGTFCLEVPEFRIDRGEKLAFIGPSGAGKTTLVYLIAGILTPQRGSIRVEDFELSGRADRQLRDFRISRIGFVFQEFELIEYLTVRDNILLPYHLNATMQLTAEARQAAESLASSMNLGDKLRRFPRTLSHGERQRVAICRALIASPDLLIADEPTGNLDPETARSMLAILLAEVERREATLLMVTHNHSLLDSFDRVIDIQDFARGSQMSHGPQPVRPLTRGAKLSAETEGRAD
ncbi:MAG: ABC transporter ATP-binding protein [Phycisphaerae bacterium]|nr:ABC transporter ATP-binding protein [Phycisphaerae bacterium]